MNFVVTTDCNKDGVITIINSIFAITKEFSHIELTLPLLIKWTI